LKPGGTREWFMKWIAAHHPGLAVRYGRLYGSGSYASKEYRAWLGGRIRYFKARHGFSDSSGFSHRDLDDPRNEEAEYPAGIIPVGVPSAAADTPTPATQATLF
jgi:hypothetical protein